jgi:hypothetical protein
MTVRNGLTERQYQDFYLKLWNVPCERQAIDDLFLETFGPSQSPVYPDEWYADKDNRMAEHPTGWLSCLVSQGGKMVWETPPSPSTDTEK